MYEDVVRDFALRTRKNLEAIETLREHQTTEVFEATQLVNSMLGLLVFRQQECVEAIPRTPLEELLREGWLIPRVIGNFPQVSDLNELVKKLRNAVAHYDIKFIGDGEDHISILRVWNMASGRMNWEVELSLTELRGIANRFIDLILQGPSAHRRPN